MKTPFFCSVLAGCLVIFSLLTGKASADTLIEYSSGHADIGVSTEGEELKLEFHFGEGAVLDGEVQSTISRGNPGDFFVRVADSARMTANGPVPFLSTMAGEDFWLLPRSGSDASRLRLPFVGLNAEDLLDGNPPFTSYTLTLSDFRGPGEFAAWQDGLFTTTVFMQTNDGVSADDNIPLGVGGHDHTNFGFTREGVYDVELTATAGRDGGEDLIDVEVFRFVVGTATAVPEPVGFAALVCGAFGLLMRRRRRTRDASSRHLLA